MDLRHLESFAAAAELRGFTRAAEARSVSQAAVSQHISALEKELRVALFERRGRSVSLTDAGRRLYEYARAVLDLVDEARERVGDSTRTVAEQLHIATCTIPPASFLPGLLGRFRKAYPHVRTIVSVSDSVGAVHAVVTGEADFGFVVKPPSDSHVSARPIACVEMVLAVLPDHPLVQCENVTFDQIRQEPFIVREQGSGSRYCVEQALEDAGISVSTLTIAMQSNSNEAICAAVKAGVGIAFLCRTAAQREIDNGSLVALSVEGIHARRHVYLITDPARGLSAAARAFVASVEDR